MRISDWSSDVCSADLDALNREESVRGILVQLPLPPQIDKAGILLAIDPAKDVDGFHPMNAGLLASDSDGNDHRIVPCTPMGCMILLADEIGSLEGMNAVVEIGRASCRERVCQYV